jgi:hypothetical protein
MFFVFFVKIQKKNTNAYAQKYKIEKNTNQQFQKYKIQRKDKFKNKPGSQPRVHCGNQETNWKKKIKTNHLYFPNPAVLILYFFVFVFLNIGRRRFCSLRGLLNTTLSILHRYIHGEPEWQDRFVWIY